MSDQYYSIYRVMAVEIPNVKDKPGRRSFTPAEVDAMDLATVAVILGVGPDGRPVGDGETEARGMMAEMARRRKTGERVNWTDL